MTRFRSSDRLQAARKRLFAGLLLSDLGRDLGHEQPRLRLRRQHNLLFAGTLRDRSDGTRTRDLRRDRPHEGHDGWRRWTRKRSIHAAFGASAIRFRMVERSRFQTFAARLLPGLVTRRACTTRFGLVLEPSSTVERGTSLRSAPIGNWSKPVATVLACFSRFRGPAICHRLPVVATARLNAPCLVRAWWTYRRAGVTSP